MLYGSYWVYRVNPRVAISGWPCDDAGSSRNPNSLSRVQLR